MSCWALENREYKKTDEEHAEWIEVLIDHFRVKYYYRKSYIEELI